jgi:type IV secretory pathway VirB10-like protein
LNVLTLKQAVFVATLSLCSVTAWAQQGAAPAKNAAPPPADLEPGVNTSATQPSLPEPAQAAPPAPVPKPAPTTAKRAPQVSPPANTATAPSSAPAATASTGTKAAASKPGGSGKAHDSLELDTTQITGNRELPKVLYIVPWKRSDLGDLVGKPVNSLLDEVLQPVDRDVFKRQNRYYDALKPDDAKDAAGAASDPASGKH